MECQGALFLQGERYLGLWGRNTTAYLPLIPPPPNRSERVAPGVPLGVMQARHIIVSMGPSSLPSQQIIVVEDVVSGSVGQLPAEDIEDSRLDGDELIAGREAVAHRSAERDDVRRSAPAVQRAQDDGESGHA